MAKLLKTKKHVIAPKKSVVEAAKKVVLVGTYKEGQLAWIKRHAGRAPDRLQGAVLQEMPRRRLPRGVGDAGGAVFS